jgi:predicted site-specific integrase-resolvase
MGNCCAKVCGSQIPSIRFKLNVVSSCCKADNHSLVIQDDADFDKLKDIIKELNHHESIKISKSKLYAQNI